MKRKITTLLLCVGILGLMGTMNQVENSNPVQYMQQVDPGGS